MTTDTDTDNKIPDHIEVKARDLNTYIVRGFYASPDQSEFTYVTATGETLSPLRTIIADLDTKAAESFLFPIHQSDFWALDDGTLWDDILKEDGQTLPDILGEEQETDWTVWDDICSMGDTCRELHGEENHDPITWMAILSARLGSVAVAVEDWRFGGLQSPQTRPRAVLLAATTVAFIQSLDRALWRWPVPVEVPVLALPAPAEDCIPCPDCSAPGVVTKSIERGFWVGKCSRMSKCPAFPITGAYPSEGEARDAWNAGKTARTEA